MDGHDRTENPGVAEAASRWVVAIFALIGLIVGLVLYTLQDRTYQAEASVNVNNPIGTMAEEAAFALSDRVMDPVQAILGYAPQVEISENELAELLTVTVRDNQAERAAQAASLVAQTYVESRASTAASVASEAEVPANPVSPNALIYLIAGTSLGALIGLALSAVQSVRDSLPGRGDEQPLQPIRPAQEATGLAERITASRAGSTPDPETNGGEASEADEADGIDPDSETVDVRDGIWRQPDGAGRGQDPSQAPVDEAAAAPDRKTAGTGSSRWSDHSLRSTPAPSSTFVAASRTAAHDPFAAATATTATGAPDAIGDSPDSARTTTAGSVAALILSPAEPGGAASTEATAASSRPDDTGDPEEFEEFEEFEDQEYISASQIQAEVGLSEVEAQRIENVHELALIDARHRQAVANLRRDLTEAKRSLRTATVNARRTSGSDQTRIGDLEAQLEAAQTEVETVREQLESQRVTHLREMTAERESADRALDLARKDFRRQVTEIKADARKTSVNDRADLDQILAHSRAEHQGELDSLHTRHDAALTAERERRRSDLQQLRQAHDQAIADLKRTQTEAIERRRARTKAVIAALRAGEKAAATQIEDLKAASSRLRRELNTARKTNRTVQQDADQTVQNLRDELAVTKRNFQREQDRSAALRDDVLRQTARANRQADKEVDDRTARLAEVDELMNRHRERAERRIREATEAAESRVREAGRREDELLATIADLRRRLAKHEPLDQ